MATRRDRQATAEAIQRLLDLVDAGEIEAESPQDRRLLRRLEGAKSALEADASGQSGRSTAHP